MTDVTITCATPRTNKPAPKGKPEPKEPIVKAKGKKAKLPLPPRKPAQIAASATRTDDDGLDIPEVLRRPAPTKAAMSTATAPKDRVITMPKVEKKADAEIPAVKKSGTKKAKVAAREAAIDKQARKGTPKAKTERKSAYDWEAAAAKAAKGEIPPLPPFASYGPHIANFRKLAVAKDVKGINDYTKTFRASSAHKNMFRFRDLCLLALKNA